MYPQTMRFGPRLVQLVIASGYLRKNHAPDWITFAKTVPDVSYESLRKAITEERPVSEKVMRSVAAALNVEPTTFVEYRLMYARRGLDPSAVGWTRAIENLVRWEAAQESRVG